MAQATVLAAGQTLASSTSIVVAAGSAVTVGIFASSPIPNGVVLNVCIDTPGSDAVVTTLDRNNPAVALNGPGSYVVKRGNISAYGVNVGVFTEDGE